MNTATIRQHATATTRIGRASPRPISEGWITLLLHLAVLAVTAATVLRVERADRLGVLVPLAICGLLLGAGLALLGVSDIAAHASAFVTGAVASLFAVAAQESGFRELYTGRGRPAYELGRDIWRTMLGSTGERASDRELLALIGMTLWLVGYSSAWMLYRRHWLIPALALPSMMVFVSLRFEDEPPTAALFLLLLCALVMTARHHLFTRRLEWERARVPVTAHLPMRFTGSALALSLVALTFAWSVTPALPDRLPDSMAKNVDRLADWANQRWNDMSPGSGTAGSRANYTAFDDSFVMGQEIELSKDPVVSVASDRPYYVALRRYDIYTGSGWTTSSGTSNDTGNGETPPQMTFAVGQQIPTGTSMLAPQDPATGDVTVYASKNRLLFTIEDYATSSVQTQVSLGWRTFGETEIPIASVDLASVPPDLLALVSDLKAAGTGVAPGEPGTEPQILDPTIAARVSREREHLRLYPVQTRLRLAEDGSLELLISGRLPNYEDVTAVYYATDEPPVTYRVSGNGPVLDEVALRAAGLDYPAWVTARYLQKADGESERTGELARRIVREAGADNPYDEARAIEAYLRSSVFTYMKNSDPPKKGVDFVDDFLFNTRTGRCEHFASAMVVMLRDLGIPARLVSGFRPDPEEHGPNGFLYREEQAHTWVEVYFPGHGWLPFEPTRGVPAIDYGPPDAGSQDSPVFEPTVEPTAAPEPTPTVAPEASPAALAPATNPNGTSGSGGPVSRLTSALAVAIGLIAAVGAIGLFAWSWGLRGLSPAAGLYARAMRIGKLWGVRADAVTTPTEFASRVATAVPAAGIAARRISDLYERERYGGDRLTGELAESGSGAWKRLRGVALRRRPHFRHRQSR